MIYLINMSAIWLNNQLKAVWFKQSVWLIKFLYQWILSCRNLVRLHSILSFHNIYLLQAGSKTLGIKYGKEICRQQLFVKINIRHLVIPGLVRHLTDNLWKEVES